MSDDLARALDACLSALARGEKIEGCLSRYPRQRAELAPLLRAARSIRETAPVMPPAEWREAGRLRLMNRIAARQAAAGMPDRAPVRRFRLGLPAWSRLAAGAVATLLVATMLAGGTLVASASALPDEPLYPVKRAVETARVALTFDEAGRASLHIDLAERRLSEQAELARRGQGARAEGAAGAYGEELGRALAAIERAQAAGGDVGPLIERFNQQLDQHQETLAWVLEQVPPAARPGIERAIEASQQSQQRAQSIKERQPQPDEQRRTATPEAPAVRPDTTPATKPASPVPPAKVSPPSDNGKATPPGKVPDKGRGEGAGQLETPAARQVPPAGRQP